MKEFFKKLKSWWNVTPHKCNPEQFRGLDGNINLDSLNYWQAHMNKLAREQQFKNRMLIIGAVLAVPFIICVYLLIFKVILCLGLLLGCIIMLLN